MASVLGNLLAGYLGKINVRYNFAVMALLLTIVFLTFAIMNIALVHAVLLILLWGIAAGMVPSSINIWMYIHVPHLTEKGSALITFMFLILILITISSLVGGFLMDKFNGTTLMASMLTITALAFLLVFTMARGLSNQPTHECDQCC